MGQSIVNSSARRAERRVAVPDAVFESVRRHFSETELVELTVTVGTINLWNRLSIAARLVPDYPVERVSSV